MDIVMITASPRIPSQSNTIKIAEEFRLGLIHAGASVQTYCLADRMQWDAARDAFFRGNCIVMALPLYNGMVPGTMMEFLEKLSADTPSLEEEGTRRKLAFILHSGFPEACQRRCCERYLETFSKILGCRFSGVLSHGNTFNVQFSTSPKGAAPLSYEMMGQMFVESGGNFFFEEAVQFTGPEYITEKDAKIYNRIFRFFCEHTAQAHECKESLFYQPYSTKQ